MRDSPACCPLPPRTFVQASQHEGGFVTTRGRLEGNTDGTVADQNSKRSLASAGTGGSEAQQAREPPTSSRRSTGVRWGATEGGLDKLGWVRNLVGFGEYKQRQQAGLALSEATGEQAAAVGGAPAAPTALDTIGWLESGAGLRPPTTAAGSAAPSVPGQAAAVQVTQGPALRSREEVGLLQSWLQDMMAQVIAQAGQPQQPQLPLVSTGEQAAELSAAEASGTGAADPAASASQLADAALWVYGMAFEELQRQVGTECGDRGALLAGVWQHVFSLVELRWVPKGGRGQFAERQVEGDAENGARAA